MTDLAPMSSEFLRQLVMWLSIGLPGLSAGTSDPQLVQAIPADAVFAVVWSGQGAGVADAPGLSGAMADPELVRAADALRQLAEFTSSLEQSTQDAASAAVAFPAPDRVAKLLFQHPGACFVALGPPDFSGRRGLSALFRVGLIVNPGEHADQFQQQLQETLPAWVLAGPQANSAPQVPTTGLLQHQVVGTRYLWTIGRSTPDLVQRLSATPDSPVAGGLAQSAEFQRLFAAVNMAQPGLLTWVQIPAAAAQMAAASAGLPVDTQLQIQSALKQVGVLRVLSVTGLEEGHVVSRLAVPRTQVTAPSPENLTTIPPEVWHRIPADAHVVAAVRCDWNHFAETALGWVAQVTSDPEGSRESLRQKWAEATGIPLDEQGLRGFGSVCLLSSAPSTGGAYGLGPVCSIDVRELQAATETYQGVLTWLQSQFSGAETRLAEESFAGQTLYTLQYRDRNPSGMAPSFCLTDSELLLALQPQTLRAHLRFRQQKGPTFADTLVRQPGIDGASLALLYVDAPKFTEAIWPLLPVTANAPLNRLSDFGLQVDANVWPSTAAILQYSRPMLATVREGSHSYICEVRNPLSLAAPVLAGAAFVALQKVELPYRDADAPQVQVELGAPAGGAAVQDGQVQPAQFEQPAPGPNGREWIPGLIRAVTPDDVEAFIPDDVFRKIQAGPDPERQQQRAERRRQRERQRTGTPE